jgi:alpha-L-rhamnosidase
MIAEQKKIPIGESANKNGHPAAGRKGCPKTRPVLPSPAELHFSWIWDGGEPRPYNAWRWFRRSLHWEGGAVQIAITADTRYRLWVNGEWVADGPVRSWPEHYQADALDLTPYLRSGQNEIRVLVHFFGCGNFHVIPQRAGLAAVLYEEEAEVLRTDESWEVAVASGYLQNAPRIAIQLSQVEIFDARLAGREEWRPATPLNGPLSWKIKRWRDVVMPIRERIEVKATPEAHWLRQREPILSIPLLRLLYPGIFAQSIRMSRAMALAAQVEVTQAGEFQWFLDGKWDVFIDGQKLVGESWQATPGKHRVLAAHTQLFGDGPDCAFGYPQNRSLKWRHPLVESVDGQSPWMLLQPEDLKFQGDDHYWLGHPSAFLDDLQAKYGSQKERWQNATQSADHFFALLAGVGKSLPHADLFYPDPDADFRARQPESQAPVECAESGWIIPAGESRDVELQFDLGNQFCGFHELTLDAPAGTIIDVALVEFIREDGVIQHTINNRNGFRYVAKEGSQTFLTRQRRSGRHLFVTVRQATRPVRLEKLTIIESRYPAESPRPFRCNDDLLTQIWSAAHRTMQLSMDDVYIDSLYEQTLWVGDARVEQLYGLRAYDARDISLRSMRLAAESAFRAPMVLSQVPSCWENILPNWSFLWVISVWDYYDYSGDTAALRELWPAVKKTLRGASYQMNERGLFEAQWWNFFEWAHVDNNHRTVLYNSMFLLGAVQAAHKCESVLNDVDERGWLESFEKRLRWGIESLWNPAGQVYHESVSREGKLSGKFSIHPQFLAALYGAADRERGNLLLEKISRPQKDVEGIASPFALQFYCEALEKFGREEEILGLFRKYYEPMVKTGTTLWEALPDSRTTPPGFPTRSHCHGWSACPLDFLPRIILGLRATSPGGRKFVVSPQPHGLTNAEGCLATPFGPILVRWILEQKRLHLVVEHPPKCEVVFAVNERLKSVVSDFNVEMQPVNLL